MLFVGHTQNGFLTSALSEQRMNVSTQCESEACCANMRVKGAIKRGISPFFGLECRDLATQVFANVLAWFANHAYLELTNSKLKNF